MRASGRLGEVSTRRATNGQVGERAGTAGLDWVDVGTAARVAGVDTRVVRTWYRSGEVPVRRVDDGGATRFLVPLGEVRRRADALEVDPAAEVAEAERRAADARKLQLEAEARLDELADLVADLRSQLTRANQDAGRLHVRVRQLEAALRRQERPADPIVLDEPAVAVDLTLGRQAAATRSTANPWSFPLPPGKGDEGSRLLGMLADLPPVRFLPRDEEAGLDGARARAEDMPEL